MTRYLPAALALTAALAAAPAMAHVVLASDHFDAYTSGALNGSNGGTGWGGAWTDTGSTNAVVSPTAASDAPMSGQSLRLSGNAEGAATRQLAHTITGNVLISFDFQFDAGTLSNNDFMGFWFGTSDGPNIGLKANCGNSCTDDLFARTSGSDAGGHAQDMAVGTTYTILGYLRKMGASTVYNRFDLWVNPTAHEWATLTGADAFDIGNASISSFSQIGFRTATLSNGDALRIDNLAISKVPEPGTLALLGLALAGIAAVARRRQV